MLKTLAVSPKSRDKYITETKYIDNKDRLHKVNCTTLCHLNIQADEKDKRKPLHQDGNPFEPLDWKVPE